MFVKINEKMLINLDHVYQIRFEGEDLIRLSFLNGYESLIQTDGAKFVANIQSQILKPGSIPIKSFLKDELI
jgi:hypothetical protein